MKQVFKIGDKVKYIDKLQFGNYKGIFEIVKIFPRTIDLKNINWNNKQSTSPENLIKMNL